MAKTVTSQEVVLTAGVLETVYLDLHYTAL